MVLYILTGYGVLGIVSLDQLTGAHYTHTHTYLIMIREPTIILENRLKREYIAHQFFEAQMFLASF